jgi:hypothetical protein
VFQCRVEPGESAAPDDREQGNRVRLWIRAAISPIRSPRWRNRDVPEGDVCGFTAPQIEPKASNNHRTADDEGVLPAEAGTEFVIWDVAA